MIDIVIPKQNEEEFIKVAELLGYKSLCFFYKEMKPIYQVHLDNIQKKTKLRLYSCSGTPGKAKSDILAVRTADPRKYLEDRHVDVVFSIENSEERDKSNQRTSGLNHILCAIAKQNSKIICFDFSLLLNSRGHRRAILIGRMKQNIGLCRKYKVKTAIASFAESPLKMRNHYDIIALFAYLGMNEGDARRSFASVEDHILLKRKKASGEYISEGIEKA